MGNMKRLHEAIQEAQRLSKTPSLDAEWMESLFGSINEIARHGNQGTYQLLDALFPRRESTRCHVCRAEAAGIRPCENCGTPVCPECVRTIGCTDDEGCSSCC